MTEKQDPNKQLLEKLEALLQKQELFSKEINELRNDIEQLKGETITEAPETSDDKANATPISTQPKKKSTSFSLAGKINKPPKLKANIEKFIGENLINKIGIIIIVIGVGIGAKYAIEHKMISPLTRIIIGYLVGVGLMGFAMKLKAKYENYSAVLLSGALAIMYFITFAAYDFYQLIPQLLAFALMLVFTVFTTLAAIQYNKQVIAHIGFVGAYAVPFLLSDGSGRHAILLAYIAIINAGILFVSLKKYWKSLYYSAFILTWLIYFVLYETQLMVPEDFALLVTYLTIYFLTFYGVFIGYKLIKKEQLSKLDIVLVMSNSFIFYGLGYSIFDDHEIGTQLLGVFTLINAIIHFGVSVYINKLRLADRNLFYLVTGMVLTFITIAIPVQLNGHWVTLLWVGEAALLFWIGRAKGISIYEKLAYPLMLLAFISIMHDWSEAYHNYSRNFPETKLTLIFNIQFLSSALTIAGFAFINYLHGKFRLVSPIFKRKWLNDPVDFLLPGLLLVITYFSFYMEISNYWNQLFIDSYVNVPAGVDRPYDTTYFNYDYNKLGGVWLLNYTLAFFTILTFVNIKWFKNSLLGLVNLGFNALTIVLFLFLGLFLLSELRESYLAQELAEFYHRGWFLIGIRYISLAFFGAALYASYRYLRQEFVQANLWLVFDIVLYTSVLWIASSELIHWMDLSNSAQSYKLGLSILWGSYALAIIVLGIWKSKKHLRIGAISLFGITLLKLFFYDISHLNTISKTIVFVVLGVLLLVISFLYNKYKNTIFDEGDEKN